MILIADSGSTKTEWMLLSEGKILRNFHTNGFNPYYYGVEAIQNILFEELPRDLPFERISAVYYYGSGCSTPTNCGIVATAFRAVFPASKLVVQHDLLAAAHALLGRKAGIACILGTGSNSCYYDGVEIVENVPSLGYILGDEGSGVHIGKALLQAILYGKAPETLLHAFDNAFGLSLEKQLSALYNNEKQGRHLASFAPFVKQNLHNPFCKELVAGVFDGFIRVQLLQYSRCREVEVSFVGSVAYHFSQILRERLLLAGLTPGTIVQSPSQGLVDYYAA